MPTILFGKPLVFWFGVLALLLFLLEILFGILIRKGNSKMFKYHKINAIVLTIIVLIHAILALILYI